MVDQKGAARAVDLSHTPNIELSARPIPTFPLSPPPPLLNVSTKRPSPGKWGHLHLIFAIDCWYPLRGSLINDLRGANARG